MSVHSYTLVDALVKTGDYNPPWLWSVAEVAKQCSDISTIFGIGGVGYFPIPSAYPRNDCNEEQTCTDKFQNAIIQYNRTRDTKTFESLSCECKTKWNQICDEDFGPLKDRIQAQLERVEAMLPSYKPTNNTQNPFIRSKRLLMNYSQ